MMKKFAVVLMVMAMLLVATGCQKKEEVKATEAPVVTEAPAAEAPVVTEAPAAEATTANP